MSESAQIIPNNYTPYPKVIFCSNRLRNIKFLISNNKVFVPLLIGKADIPLVWVYRRTENDNYDFVQMVHENIPLYDSLQVIVDKELKVIRVEVDFEEYKHTLLSLTYSNDEIIINKINLTFLGYPITGDETSLIAAGTILSNNFFENDTEFIDIVTVPLV